MPYRLNLLKGAALCSRLEFKVGDRCQLVYGIVEALTVAENFKKREQMVHLLRMPLTRGHKGIERTNDTHQEHRTLRILAFVRVLSASALGSSRIPVCPALRSLFRRSVAK